MVLGIRLTVPLPVSVAFSVSVPVSGSASPPVSLPVRLPLFLSSSLSLSLVCLSQSISQGVRRGADLLASFFSEYTLSQCLCTDLPSLVFTRTQYFAKRLVLACGLSCELSCGWLVLSCAWLLYVSNARYHSWVRFLRDLPPEALMQHGFAMCGPNH